MNKKNSNGKIISMKTSTKILLIINLICLVGTGVFFTALISFFDRTGGLAFTWTKQTIVAIIFFVLWAISGLVLFVKFIKRLTFPRKLFFSTVMSTAVFAFLLIVVYNINSINYAPIATVRQVAGIGQNFTIIYIIMAVLAVLYLVFLAVSFRLLSRPIKRINGIVSDINKGNQKIKYKVGGGREFVEIATGLSQIDKKLTEKDKIIKVANDEYEKIVPKQFVKHLGKKSFSELELGGSVTKEVTTMFCDIRNSTLTSESLSLTDNFKFINDYLAVITPIIRKYQGFVDKYLGDGVLAVFSNANSALRASVEIVKEIRVKNMLDKKPYEIEVGIGLHTGEVVFGVVGDEQRKSPTIISDNVNYTSKMQEVSKVYGTQIIFSKRTLNVLKNDKSFEYRYIGLLTFNGEKRFAMFELLDTYEQDQRYNLKLYKNEFEEAVRLFDAGKFAQALAGFKKLQSKLEFDKVTSSYIHHIQSLKKQ